MRSRRSLERFILGATGFRGRSLAAGPGAAAGASAADDTPAALPDGAPAVQLAQPAHAAPLRIGDAGEEETAGADASSGPGSQVLLPGGSAGGPVLVSVLLPANASEGGAGGERPGAPLAASDKVFVVLLHPRQRYVAYSCALPRPVAL